MIQFIVNFLKIQIQEGTTYSSSFAWFNVFIQILAPGPFSQEAKNNDDLFDFQSTCKQAWRSLSWGWEAGEEVQTHGHSVPNLASPFSYPVEEGNGNPLQYSCLENPMDRGAWKATVHGVAKSWTRLRDFTFPFMHWRRKWQPTPVFLPGESQGQRSLLGCRLWGRTESDTTDAT